MTNQDLTAPVDRVKASRREAFSRAYELYEGDVQRNLTGFTFTAEVYGPEYFIRLLTEASGISRPAAETVVVSLTADQMKPLVGTCKVLLFGTRSGEKEMMVQLLIQIDL